jgi:hypothetical protein
MAQLQYRIFQNGTGWYWEVVTADREVIERGVTATDVEARVQAIQAAVKAGPSNRSEPKATPRAGRPRYL